MCNTCRLETRDDVIIPTAGSCGTAKERMENQGDDTYCLDWFMFSRRKRITCNSFT